MALEIRGLRESDWATCRRIYEEGIATGSATFEEAAPDWASWHAAHLTAGRLVAIDGDAGIVGWAALSPVSDRCAYAGVAEASIYVTEAARGRGVGTRLMRAALDAADAAGIWTVQAGILVENAASIALAERTGFRRVGVRERLGKLNGAWRDVLLLERRSDLVGTD
jgi:phosphinothricin acetyltransferase